MTDYIKRQDAIEALGEEPYVWSDTDAEIAEHAQWVSDVKAIEAVPSAGVVELEVSPVCYKCDGKTHGIRTEKCLWLNGDNSKCIEQAHKLLYLAERGERYEQIHYGIEPSNYVLQKRGKWELVSTTKLYESGLYVDDEIEEKCSLCGCHTVRYETQKENNFCPNCGADMRKSDE